MPTRVPVNWKSEVTGQLSGVSIHDGRIVDFRASMACQSYVISNSSSEIVEIELTGLVEFNVVRFWRGAVSSDVFLWKLMAVPSHLWSIPDSAWNILFDGRASTEDAKIAAARLIQARPEAFLFNLSCSYGGAFAAICDGINVYRHV